MNKRKKGEQIFEQYMKSQGFSECTLYATAEQHSFFDTSLLTANQFVFEPKLENKNKPPDYLINLDREYLFEVKEFDPRPIDLGECFGVDQYKLIRDKIDAAKDKFKEYKDWACCLVLYKNSPSYVELEKPHIMLGAMEGDFGYTSNYNSEGYIQGSTRPAFLDNGKMFRRKWAKPANTRISALISLREISIGLEKQVGVIIWENRFANVPFPKNLFSGDYDLRWGLNEAKNAYEEIFIGEGLRNSQKF